MKTMRNLFLSSMIGIFFLLSCTNTKQVSSFSISFSPHFKQYKLQRLFFIPFQEDQKIFSSTLKDTLAKNKTWEIFFSPLPSSYPLSPSHIPASSLSYVATKYNAHAIALGHISHFSLTPMRISLRWQIISVYDGKILYSIEGTWEDKSIYSLDYQDIPQSISGLSVEKFFSEVCLTIAEGLKNL